MEEFKQDLTENEDSEKLFMMQLLFEEECEMPEESDIDKIMKKHLGDSVECVQYSKEVAGCAVTKYKLLTDEGSSSPMLSIFKCLEFDGKRVDSFMRSQMWDRSDHDEILDSCKYQVLATDMLSSWLHYKERADMLMDFLEALVELFPSCMAVFFVNSGKLFTAEDIRTHEVPHDARFICFAVNVRFFKISGTDEMVVDSLGMSTLFMPDLQYHFHDIDPNLVIHHAYNMLTYMYDNENPIRNGNSIDGIKDGQLSRLVRWECQYEDSLIQPVREVIDVNMGELASGTRE